MNRALHFLLTLFITLQFIMQPVQGAVHGGEVFEAHKPHRTTSAAIGGRSGGAGCASGAASGIVQSFYAGTLDGSTLTREQKLANAKLIGAVAGFFASGGKAQNVSLASSIAESGLANNYLKHQQVSEMARELEECGNTPDCSIEKLIEKYKGLSDGNRAEMLACKTIQCWEKHRDAIIESNKIIGSIGADAFTKGLLADGFEENFVANFAKEENQESIKYISTRTTLALSKQILETWGKTNCNGVYDLSCVQSFQTQATSESFLSSSIEVIELVTPYGTIVDGYTCATSLSASACVSAIISVILAGKLAQIGGKVFIRVGGGKIVEATVSAAGKVKTKLFAPNRTLDEIAPSGKIPSVASGKFNKWFDDLTPDEFDKVWADPNLRRKVENQIRKPGSLHEWCMVCKADKFKRWGVSMDEIHRFRTGTTDLVGTNPKTGKPFAHSVKDPVTGEVKAGPGSKTFHNELQSIIDNSGSLKDFNQGVQQLRDRWKIDPSLLPDLPKQG